MELDSQQRWKSMDENQDIATIHFLTAADRLTDKDLVEALQSLRENRPNCVTSVFVAEPLPGSQAPQGMRPQKVPARRGGILRNWLPGVCGVSRGPRSDENV